MTWKRATSSRTRGEVEPLSDAVTHLLEECRMVLPGIQALFGFQLIAVFNQVFWDRLLPIEQILHLAAICLVACSVALVMTPAAYHRLAEPRTISQRLVALANLCLSSSMYPLMVALCIDLYLIQNVILQNWIVSLLLTLVLFAVFAFLWVAFPRLRTLHKLLDTR